MINKTLSKRFRVTAKGKLLHRPRASAHFRTHKSNKNILSKRKTTELSYKALKKIAY